MIYLVRTARGHELLRSHEVEEAQGELHGLWAAAALTMVGIVAITVGGTMVAQGATRVSMCRRS